MWMLVVREAGVQGVVILAFPKTLLHFEKMMLVVVTTLALS